MKKKTNKLMLGVSILLVLGMVLSACGTEPTKGTSAEPTKETEAPAYPTETKAEPTEPAPTEGSSAAQTEPAPTETEAKENPLILEARVQSEEAGIYACVLKLNPEVAAPKGFVEFLYYGKAGTPQENTVVCTYTADYHTENGKFEIYSKYDGQIDQNQHAKSEIKVACTFGALVRAEYVIISYQPDGGEKQEIKRISYQEGLPKSK